MMDAEKLDAEPVLFNETIDDTPETSREDYLET
jgi:hypothetical protein